MRNSPSSLRPETIRRNIERGQASIPQSFDSQLMAACMAFQSAENSIAWYSLRQPNPQAEQVARATAARFRVKLQDHLAQLVISQ